MIETDPDLRWIMQLTDGQTAEILQACETLAAEPDRDKTSKPMLHLMRLDTSPEASKAIMYAMLGLDIYGNRVRAA